MKGPGRGHGEGKPLDDAREYPGVDNSYFAGKALRGVVTDTGRPRLEVIREYVRAKKTITPSYDGRRIVGRETRSRAANRHGFTTGQRSSSMRLDAGQIEVLDPAMADVLRRKTPAERLAIASGIWESVRIMLLTQLAERHPDWSPPQVEREVVRRMSHGAV